MGREVCYSSAGFESAMKIAKMEDIETRILLIRAENVLLDSDMATIYGVATREINQAVANNPEKFSGRLYHRIDC
jgi:hypothetical protein